MCGIFGFSVNEGSTLDLKGFEIISRYLFRQTETRGKDASGLALLKGNNIAVLKEELSASQLIKGREYSSLLKEYLIGKSKRKSIINEAVTIIGHSRMVTNGSQENHDNNQPVIKNGKVIIHNGIIVNDSELWKSIPIKRNFEVDTEIILSLIEYYKETDSLVGAIKETYKRITGVASIALLFNDYNYLMISTNNGSLYYASSEHEFMFASEKHMLLKVCQKFSFFKNFNIIQLKAGEALFVSRSSLQKTKINLFNEVSEKAIISEIEIPYKIIDLGHGKETLVNLPNKRDGNFELLLENNKQKIGQLKRCTKCLLPETFPFIQFSEDGVCNMCLNHKKVEYKGEIALQEAVKQYKSLSGNANFLVPFSGGRDSSYSLHYIKKELGLNPIAFTYDWGMVTDLARRNISRMCSKLGIEHIIVSADINKKREFIKKNVSAWLKNPELGMIPLFMAGDKQYFYYLNQILRQNNIKIAIYGENPYEKTNFKTGFCGINEEKSRVYYDISLLKKIQLGLYYTKNFIRTPEYINSSLIDTVGAYLSAYFLDHNVYMFLYQYIIWDEDLINQTLIREYNWELSPDTVTTWRIGDGTASFYNYIYYTVAGFTENDTLRSNQIREGILSREKALEITVKENTPRYESIKWYLDTIGLDFESTINIINKIPKLF
jgi:glutamine---fructose-6-phosphate transaminase (isomerizing)